jgi:hypothetical protein
MACWQPTGWSCLLKDNFPTALLAGSQNRKRLNRRIDDGPFVETGSAEVGDRDGTVFEIADTGSHSKYSHIAVPALDGLPDYRCRDLIGDLDVPHLAFALRGEVGEELRDDRQIAYLVAAQAEAASDVFERG